MNYFKTSLYICLTLFLQACAVNIGYGFREAKIEKGQASIYIFRPYSIFGMTAYRHPIVYVNGHRVGPLKLGGYYQITVKPDTYFVGFHSEGGPLAEKSSDFYIKAGESVYLEYREYSVEDTEKSDEDGMVFFDVGYFEILGPVTGEGRASSTTLMRKLNFIDKTNKVTEIPVEVLD